MGVFELLLDVLDGDEAFEFIGIVDDEELFDAVVVQDLFGVLEGGADGDGDEVFLGHDIADGNIGAADEAEIAVGENADELAAFGDGDAGDLVAAHNVEGVGDRAVGLDGDRVDDHAGLGTLDLVDLAGLGLDGEVAVHDAEAALLGHGDGHAGLGDGVHGRRHQRGGEGDPAGQASLRADLRGDDVGVGGDEQDIVEGQGFRYRGAKHTDCLILLQLIGRCGKAAVEVEVAENEQRLQARSRIGEWRGCGSARFNAFTGLLEAEPNFQTPRREIKYVRSSR